MYAFICSDNMQRVPAEILFPTRCSKKKKRNCFSWCHPNHGKQDPRAYNKEKKTSQSWNFGLSRQNP